MQKRVSTCTATMLQDKLKKNVARITRPLCKINIKKSNICHLIPLQTLSFLTAWLTQQDGVENLDKAYM